MFEFLLGSPEQTRNISTIMPQQQQMQDQLLRLLGPQMQQQFGIQGGFAPIEAQMRSGFKQKTIPSIMERFAATGGESESGLPQMLGSAATEFETGLGALRSQYGQQQNQQLLQLLGMAMHPGFEPIYQPRQPGFLEAAAPYGLSTLLKLLPMLL